MVHLPKKPPLVLPGAEGLIPASRRGLMGHRGMMGAAGGGGDDFNPFTDLTDIVHGWRADVGLSLTGSDVDQWDDQVGSWNLLDDGTKPTLVSADVNGQDVISFGGAGGLLSGGSASVSIPFLICMVFEHTTFQATDRFFEATSNPTILQSSSSPNVRHQGASDGVNVSFALNTYFLLRAYFSNSTSDYLQLDNEAPGTGINVGSAALTQPIALGQRPSGANRSICKMAEVLILEADLTGAEETSYLAYISSRYGIS